MSRLGSPFHSLAAAHLVFVRPAKTHHAYDHFPNRNQRASREGLGHPDQTRTGKAVAIRLRAHYNVGAWHAYLLSQRVGGPSVPTMGNGARVRADQAAKVFSLRPATRPGGFSGKLLFYVLRAQRGGWKHNTHHHSGRSPRWDW